MFLPSLLRRATWLTAVLLLTAAGAARAQGAAPATPANVDAWGQKVDLAQQVREDLTDLVAGEMGSPDWAPLAFQVLDMHGEVLPRMLKVTTVDLHCGKRYRANHPEASREQYEAHLATEAGEAWESSCIAEHLADPQVDPNLADSILASMEVALILPGLLQAVRDGRAQRGLTDVPELTPEMAEQLPPLVKSAFAKVECLFREVLKTVPLGKILTDPVSFQGPFQAAAESGVCSAVQAEAPPV